MSSREESSRVFEGGRTAPLYPMENDNDSDNDDNGGKFDEDDDGYKNVDEGGNDDCQ